MYYIYIYIYEHVYPYEKYINIYIYIYIYLQPAGRPGGGRRAGGDGNPSGSEVVAKCSLAELNKLSDGELDLLPKQIHNHPLIQGNRGAI